MYSICSIQGDECNLKVKPSSMVGTFTDNFLLLAVQLLSFYSCMHHLNKSSTVHLCKDQTGYRRVQRMETNRQQVACWERGEFCSHAPSRGYLEIRNLEITLTSPIRIYSHRFESRAGSPRFQNEAKGRDALGMPLLLNATPVALQFLGSKSQSLLLRGAGVYFG